MGRKKVVEETPKEVHPIRRAVDPDAREKQLIALSMNLVEERLLNGTASAQEVCHFLKLGSMEKQLEMEKLKKENKLLEAKTDAIASQQRSEELFAKAIEAMKTYSGSKEEY